MHGYIIIMQMFWMLLGYLGFKLHDKVFLRRTIYEVAEQQGVLYVTSLIQKFCQSGIIVKKELCAENLLRLPH